MNGEIVSVLSSMLRMSVPLILASLGGVFSVRGGIMALGLESMLMTGAFCAVAGSFFSGNVIVGFACGIFGGMLLGLAHGFLCIKCRVNQVISGIGLNLLMLATTTLMMQILWNNRGNSPQVESIDTNMSFLFGGIPWIGDILSDQSILTYIAIILAFVSYFVLFKTKYGIRLRMVGENPKAAASIGLNVTALKYSGVLICGALAGLGGAYLSIDHLDMFVRDMTAGRGYIAIVIAILARYNPIKVIICALLFGFCDATQIVLQGQGIPTQLIQTIPYVVTLLVLTFGVRHITPPAGVGKHEDD